VNEIEMALEFVEWRRRAEAAEAALSREREAREAAEARLREAEGGVGSPGCGTRRGIAA
jgi:hypothetical protein